MNTNEIPSELSHENMISPRDDNMLFSHMKRSLLLWLHMKIVPFDAFREMIKYFIGVYIINRILHGHLEMRSLVKYFSTLEEKFRISVRPCNILYKNYNQNTPSGCHWASEPSELLSAWWYSSTWYIYTVNVHTCTLYRWQFEMSVENCKLYRCN